jgi:hypothetical protein
VVTAAATERTNAQATGAAVRGCSLLLQQGGTAGEICSEHWISTHRTECTQSTDETALSPGLTGPSALNLQMSPL